MSVIQIQDVCKQFEGFKVLDGINIHIKTGTIHGIIGENGAGKSTLIQSLVGVYDIDSGAILIDGEPVWDNVELKRQIGYVADRNQFFKGYKIKELVNFYEGMYESFSRADFEKYNKIFKLNPNKKVKQLSKGMQMRLSFMLNLSIHPKVMVLDEPTSGLDAMIKKELLDLLIEEVERKGMTVVISSHHLNELEKLCDDVTMIQGGKITYQSSVDELRQNIKKIQVVFKEEAPKDLGTWEEFLNVQRIGNVYYLITKNYSPVIEEKLKSYDAMFITTIGLTLEEIFIYANKTEKSYVIEEVRYEQV